MLAINRNALQFAKGTKQARYLGPATLIVVGVMLTGMGVSYDGIDLAVGAGVIVIAIGLAFLVVQYRTAKALRT